MFTRINTSRINLDNVTTYEPVVSDEGDPGLIVIYYLDGKHDEFKCTDSNQRVEILKKLDSLLHCKKNLASHLPKDN